VDITALELPTVDTDADVRAGFAADVHPASIAARAARQHPATT
jgi:hypothetical protein